MYGGMITHRYSHILRDRDSFENEMLTDSLLSSNDRYQQPDGAIDAGRRVD